MHHLRAIAKGASVTKGVNFVSGTEMDAIVEIVPVGVCAMTTLTTCGSTTSTKTTPTKMTCLP